MGSLFSSPGKQAAQAAQAQGQITADMVNQVEGYVSNKEQKLREAIGGLGPNPFFGAGANMDPGAYRVNPNNTVTAGPGAMTPGITQGTPAPTLTPSPGASGPPPTSSPGSQRGTGQGPGSQRNVDVPPPTPPPPAPPPRRRPIPDDPDEENPFGGGRRHHGPVYL